jgi:hypothetical protein
MTEVHPLPPEVADERDRCAFIAERFAYRWRQAARKVRKDGTRRGWLGRRYVSEKAERDARRIENAATSFDAIAYAIRRGFDLPERKPKR